MIISSGIFNNLKNDILSPDRSIDINKEEISSKTSASELEKDFRDDLNQDDPYKSKKNIDENRKEDNDSLKDIIRRDFIRELWII